MNATVFIGFARDREPDALGRRHFFLHWWVDSGLGYSGTEAGWRGQFFFADPRPYIRRYRKQGELVALGSPKTGL